MKRIFLSIALLALSFTLYADTSAQLTIFTKPGCGRCAYTIEYLKKNNIAYTEYSTSDKSNNAKMWSTLRDSGKFKGGSISMPVVVINGETYFSIPNLKEFTESISSKLASGNQDNGPWNSETADEIIETLPDSVFVWTDGKIVVNHAIAGWMRKKLPIANHYSGSGDGVYVAVYSHSKFRSIYTVGENIYVMGLIRMKGTWNGTIAEPEGWEGKDISASDEFKQLPKQYFPACANGCWVGGDTGGIFGK